MKRIVRSRREIYKRQRSVKEEMRKRNNWRVEQVRRGRRE